jgi:hypothetical protein
MLATELLPKGVFQYLFRRRFPSRRWAGDAPIDVEAVAGAALFLRASLLRDVGPLPEDYFFFLEETDWCHRIRAAGWSIVHLPDAWVIHLYGESTKKKTPLRTRIEFYRSRYLFFRKNRSRAAYVALRGIVMVKILIGAAFGGRRADEYRKILRWHLAGEDSTAGLSGT